MEITTATPAEIDGELYPLLDGLGRQDQHLEQIEYLLGERPRYNRVRGVDEYNEPGVQQRQFEASKADTLAKIKGLEADAAPLEAEFDRRGGWTRYIVVPGGHLHKRGCHTLTPGRTMVGQVAEASGLAEDEVVAQYDETACTHCFPNAPVAQPKTPAEEGFCERSGQHMNDAEEGQLVARYGAGGWRSLVYMPSVKCQCGGHPSITKTGKIRKHKPGTPQ